MEKKDLKPGDICPCCGQKIRKYTVSEKARKANAERVRKAVAEGKKGGRPVNPNSKRQIALRKKAEQEQSGKTIP